MPAVDRVVKLIQVSCYVSLFMNYNGVGSIEVISIDFNGNGTLGARC